MLDQMIDFKTIKIGDLLLYRVNDNDDWYICSLILESFPLEEKIIDFSTSSGGYTGLIREDYSGSFSKLWQHIKC